ncbi:hypothetical protein PF008_g22952 [Phytophthora fragariae]|uniref:Uncharacterized protein n=1 Tax=Phytophthora fragariae TaxID=53985 RepID=A0A6G0QSE6_9STRA|nr:hypothetical protein PF008_g22952 [Phytophthora fragariae]
MDQSTLSADSERWRVGERLAPLVLTALVVLKMLMTTLLQKQFIVEWLEVPFQLNIIVGKSTDGRAKAFGGAQTKIAGFGLMADHVYASCISAFSDECQAVPPKYTKKWEPAVRQSRWVSYFKVYKNTKARVNSQTGSGFSLKEIDEGKTLEEAIEAVCPFYFRLDILFG